MNTPRHILLSSFLTVISLLLASVPGMAQDTESAENRKEEDFRAWLMTTGAQDGTESFHHDAGHTVHLQQSGRKNSAVITHEGDGLTVDARQIGEENALSTDIRGTGISSQLIQSGMNNTLNQNVRGDGLRYSIFQRGIDLALELEERGPNATSYDIFQTGIGMHVIIVNGAFK